MTKRKALDDTKDPNFIQFILYILVPRAWNVEYEHMNFVPNLFEFPIGLERKMSFFGTADIN